MHGTSKCRLSGPMKGVLISGANFCVHCDYVECPDYKVSVFQKGLFIIRGSTVSGIKQTHPSNSLSTPPCTVSLSN